MVRGQPGRCQDQAMFDNPTGESVEVEGGRRITTYQAKGWYQVAVVFIETTTGFEVDNESLPMSKGECECECGAWKLGRDVSLVDAVVPFLTLILVQQSLSELPVTMEGQGLGIAASN
jgi:hypothetical protein